MIKIQFLGLSPECVEGFSKAGKRTFQGALHLKPNQVYDLTKEDFEYVKKIRPDLRFHVFQIGKMVIKTKSKKSSPVKEDKKVVSNTQVDKRN